MGIDSTKRRTKTFLQVLVLCLLCFLLILNIKDINSSVSTIQSAQQIPDSSKSDNTKSHEEELDSMYHPLDRVIENNAFTVGEKLTFIVRWGIIKAGEATMAIQDTLSVRNRKAYQMISTARSAKTFDLIFKVRDKVESWIDSKGIFSWRFHKQLREGSYKFDLLVDYNQWLGKANIESIRYHNEEPLRIKNQESFDLSIPPYVLDVLAAFYYVRTQDLEIGMPLYMTNHDNQKIYNLKVIIQKREIKKVKVGKFNTIKVQPVLRGEAIFKQKGRLWIWLTDDQYKIPVLMKSAVFVGSITTELVKIEGLPLPLPSQIK